MGGGSLTSNLDLSYETSVHQSELGTWPAKKKETKMLLAAHATAFLKSPDRKRVFQFSNIEGSNA